jgi:superfamily II DNA or RNA helicase
MSCELEGRPLLGDGATMTLEVAPRMLPERLPMAGELVRVRSRQWLVENVDDTGGGSPVVELACADDDAQGQELKVFWDYEPDRLIIDNERWVDLGANGFDPPRLFAAFLNTLRWNTVTATNPDLFQSPFRAGIKIDAYQMEPLRKALRLPRVNLFIADDTGLGKTIEAGLIARELLLRKKASSIVVAAPPSVLEQWKAELEERFGLTFEILDRHYVANVRRERGFGVNPWRTHSRFLISHNLLVDPAYSDPLREWLGELLPGSLLILDEAHHAAPASGARYGIETKLTRAVRDIGARFEHRLFLSATPHNGHSNSFSTLLELLDPTRFTRGVKVRGKHQLGDVMVRRLKEDIRTIQGGGFPLRDVQAIRIDGLPGDAPELQLSILLDEYRTLREQRYNDASRRSRAAAGLLVVGLQQRLLSSIEAFARSLEVHRRTVAKHQNAVAGKQARGDETAAVSQGELFISTPDADDEPGVEETADADDNVLVASLSAGDAPSSAEHDLLGQMEKVANAHRHKPDAKVRALLEWIQEHQCPGLAEYGKAPMAATPPAWTNTRVLIFTESREGTKRYLQEVLEQAIVGTDRAEERIATITGLTSGPTRAEVQRRFNTDPIDDPLRILIATDAAREGLNFQAHCADLFHFDLPWNPGRIEQRNGRIDRKLQPADKVRCHYFVLPQRVEDRVLQVLVRKTETIRRELGSLSEVIDGRVQQHLKGGIRHADADRLIEEIEREDLEAERRQAIGEELEEARERQEELRVQIERCQNLLETSRRAVAFDAIPFRDALNCSLELLQAEPLRETIDQRGRSAWKFPALDAQAGSDPSWSATLDTLRTPRPTSQRLTDWRAEAPIRPVVFEDEGVLTEATVHLHLEQRVAQRLLGRFRAQGFVHHDLSRACLAQVRDSIPRVLLIGRLSLFGQRAERLHEQLVVAAARWREVADRSEPLQPYARDAETRTLELLEDALRAPEHARQPSEQIRERLLSTVGVDVDQLLAALGVRAQQAAKDAQAKLAERGERESGALRETLERQRDRVAAERVRHQHEFEQMTLGFAELERRELEQNMRHWERRLAQFDGELETEPARIRSFYEVRADRLEPVGLVYLWPDTN